MKDSVSCCGCNALAFGFCSLLEKCDLFLELFYASDERQNVLSGMSYELGIDFRILAVFRVSNKLWCTFVLAIVGIDSPVSSAFYIVFVSRSPGICVPRAWSCPGYAPSYRFQVQLAHFTLQSARVGLVGLVGQSKPEPPSFPDFFVRHFLIRYGSPEDKIFFSIGQICRDRL